MNKGNIVKILLLVLVTIFLGVLLIFNVTHKDKNSNNDTEWVSNEQEEVSNRDLNEDLNEGTKQATVNSESTNDDKDNDDFNSNFELKYLKEHDKNSIKKSKEVSKKVVTMWLEQDSEKKEWEAISTPSFFKKIDKELLNISDGIVRKVTKIDIYVVPVDKEEGKIKYELNATWEIKKSNKVIKKESRIFYTILTLSSDGNWLVKELIQL